MPIAGFQPSPMNTNVGPALAASRIGATGQATANPTAAIGGTTRPLVTRPSTAGPGNAGAVLAPGGGPAPGLGTLPAGVAPNVGAGAWQNYYNNPNAIPGYNPITGQDVTGTTKNVALGATQPYQDYTNYGQLANQWGQVGAGVFTGPVGQAVNSSVGGLGTAAAGGLQSQQTAGAALSQMNEAATGGMFPQQMAAQAYGPQGLGAFAGGQGAGQDVAQQWLQGGIGNAYQGAATQANGGLLGQQLQLASAGQFNPYVQGATPNQQAGQGFMGELGAYGIGQGQGQGQNQESMGLLRSAALGQEPSAAELQMRAGGEEAVRQQMAMANSARGEFGLANAQRNAVNAGAQLQQQNIQQQGILRAQEMAQARGMYQGATSQNVAQQLQALQGGGALSQGLVGQELQGLTGEQQALQSYAGLQAGGVAQQGAMGVAGTQAATNLAGQNLQAQEAQAQAANQAAATQAQAQAAYGQQAGQLSAQQIAALQAYNASAQNQQTAMLGFTNAQQANALGQSQLAGNLAIAQGNVDIQQAAQAMQQNIANQQQTSQYIGAGLAAAGMLLSDERVKEDVHQDERPANAGAALSQLDAFRPTTFRYRFADAAPNPQAADAPHVGVLAQDVERGPAGRTLVQHDERGIKHLNTGAMIGTLAAGAGALKRRTDSHEHRLAILEHALRRVA